MKVTFLSGYKPMVKAFHADRVESYPRIKRVTSHVFEVPKTAEGMRQKTELLKEHAEKGHCLLKGSLTKDLKHETRAGYTDNEALTETIVLDIDGVRFPDMEPKTPIDAAQLRELAAAAVKILPSAFHEASYIVHASSSLGMKPGLVSLHLEFWLDKPVTPILLKQYLTKLNFDVDLFRASLELTATGSALRLKLDRTLADNSRLIYIGKPQFHDGLEDPVAERILLVQKHNVTVPLYAELMQIKPQALNGTISKTVTALREQNGWGPLTQKGTNVFIDGRSVFVVTNPQQMNIQYAYHKDKWVYYNVNGGDSNAYYVHRDNPAIMHNFKGEPAFMFEQANPDAYQWHLENFGLGSAEYDEDDGEDYDSAKLVPVVLDEKRSDSSYRGYYDPVKKIFTQLDATRSQEKLRAWMEQHNALMPDQLPVWEFYFDPTSDDTTDFKRRRANTFERTDLLASNIGVPGDFLGLRYGQGGRLSELCPTIWKIIWSMTGASTLEFEHFINWFAAIVCGRQKTMTAWAMSGTPGTGKGLFTNQIAAPILGPMHAFPLTERDLSDEFNAWMERAILVTVDEFSLRKSKMADRLMLRLKNAITEPVAAIRAMRQDIRTVPSYVNFLFFSNDYGMLKIEPGDRRFNVCPRQERKLIERFPELDSADLLEMIKAELPQFVAFLKAFDFDARAAQKTLENEAKKQLHRSAATIEEEFFESLHTGDLDFFTILFEETLNRGNELFLAAAQNYVRSWIRERHHARDLERYPITTQELGVVYSAMMARSENARSFGKRLGRNGLEPQRIYMLNGERKRGLYVGWQVSEDDINDMYQAYVEDSDAVRTA